MAWNPPDPGELRETVGIEAAPLYADKPNAYREQELDWKSLGSCRAKVEPLSGREYWFAQQASSQVNFKVTIRYRADLHSQRFRLTWRNMVLNVASVVNEDGQKIWHVLMCASKTMPAQARA